MTRTFEAECKSLYEDALVFNIEDSEAYVYIAEKGHLAVKADFVLSVSDAVRLAETILEEYGNGG